MRKYQQQQILELLKTLEEAQSAGLFGDCQNGAIQIGEFIESVEGNGTQTVALLEEYCTMLYKVENGEIRAKQLKKQLIKIENSVKSELASNKIEVVFLPYNASMWDSFESVYFSAKNDPRCDVAVVPIPYYERNSDLTFGTMHYDGDKYPDYVLVTNWKNYDIQAARPDIVYVHNQYDNHNLVTSVHPDYYSFNLKPYIDMLVYVPYGIPSFLIEKPLPGKNTSIRKGDGLPSYLNYDVIILQAEAVLKPVGNVAVLGSPKYDKTLATKREDCTISEEWRHIIGGKKIVLYNTSLAALLGISGVEYLKKLVQVLEDFAHKEDIVLWWRPHPLFSETVASMRNELYKINTDIITHFKNSKTIIYDDTPDVHRAIAMSDAYYGDMSSVVNLYGLTGKPIVIQQMHVNVSDKRVSAKKWELDFEKNKDEKKVVSDYLIYEQPAECGAYSFLSSYLHDNAVAPGEKEVFVKTYVNADGTVGEKIHAYVMDAFKSAREAKAKRNRHQR